MTTDERAELVKQKKLCLACLGTGHVSRKCSSSKLCGVQGCRGKHHELLHNAKRVFAKSETVTAVNTLREPMKPQVMLQVLPVVIYGIKSQISTYAMLDMGSTCSLLRSDIADQLGLDGHCEQLSLNGIQKQTLVTAKKVSFEISPANNKRERHAVASAWTVEKLNLPRMKLDMPKEKKKWHHLSDIDLPPVDGNLVTVLLGADVFDLIVPLEVRYGPKGTPRAVRSVLGWTVTSHLGVNAAETDVHTYKVHVTSPDEELQVQVSDWWRTESFGCKFDIEQPRSLEDKLALDILESTTKKVGERYETGLLWKHPDIQLPANRQMAERQLCSLERRLKRNPELSKGYADTISKDVEKGYVKKLSPEEEKKPVKREWFLPHHAVINPNKPGKIRRVCNAAALFENTSLNDNLLIGPDLLNSLVGVLFRFREERVALSADIEAMFSQVAVPEDDQAVLRFLWRNKKEPRPSVYQFTRHIFGARSSPTSANYVLRQTGKDNADVYPEAAETIESNFYMDDLLKSTDSEEKAVKLQQKLTTVLKSGGFNLTKWCSNSRKVLAHIPLEHLAPSLKGLDLENGLPMERVLGVVWNPELDSFVLKIKQTSHDEKTQRQVLRFISSLYDPLGIIAPFILRAKVFLQELWREKRGWDEDIAESELKPFVKWKQELNELSSVSIQRFYRTVSLKPSSIQLHVFGDASCSAFSAVAYLRFEYEDGSIQCSFVIGKTRVAPLRQLSIPKLELQAAVMSTRLLNTVKKEQTYRIDSQHLWTDSTTVLQWFKSTSRRHPAFIANRTAEILESSFPSEWKHVPGRLNPADDGSRGLRASDLHSKCRWLQGPSFLAQPEMFWPMKEEEESDDASPDADDEEQAWIQTASNHSPAKSPFDSINCLR